MKGNIRGSSYSQIEKAKDENLGNDTILRIAQMRDVKCSA